jgi:hypothetical protein
VSVGELAGRRRQLQPTPKAKRRSRRLSATTRRDATSRRRRCPSTMHALSTAWPLLIAMLRRRACRRRDRDRDRGRSGATGVTSPGRQWTACGGCRHEATTRMLASWVSAASATNRPARIPVVR